MKHSSLFLPVFCILGACASTPNAEITYKKARPNVDVVFTQLLTCNPTHTKISQSARVTVAAIHTAGDPSDTTLNIKEFDGFFRDGDLSFKFYPDGRLQSVNANVTGTGEATINSIASVIGSVLGLGVGPGDSVVPPPSEIKAVCQVINQGNAKKNGVMTLTYSKVFKEDSLASVTDDLMPDDKTKINLGLIRASLLANNLPGRDLINSVNATFTANGKPFSPISFPDYDGKSLDSTNYVGLDVQKTQEYIISVVRTFNSGLNLQVENIPIPNASVTTASDQTVKVLIPKGAAFGTSKFSMVLSDMGTVSELGYNNTKGTSSAFNTANSGLQNFQKKTDEEVADSIAQQARRLRCEAVPKDCV